MLFVVVLNLGLRREEIKVTRWFKEWLLLFMCGDVICSWRGRASLTLLLFCCLTCVFYDVRVKLHFFIQVVLAVMYTSRILRWVR